MTAINEIGNTYGRLTVTEPGAVVNEQMTWLCTCECGTTTVVPGGALRRQNGTRSCGCLTRERVSESNTVHGDSSPRTPTYNSWRSMRQRCANLDNPNYGGRGISVDPVWDDYRTFLDDMGERPDGYTLNRIDNDSNYGPGLCDWATPTEQCQNKSRKI